MLLYLKRAGNTMERSLIFRGYPLQDIMPRRAENNICAGVMELADVTDSKSVDGNIVWVRVPPPAPRRGESLWLAAIYFCKSRLRLTDCRSFSAKSHAAPLLLACKRAHDAPACYQLFAGRACAAASFLYRHYTSERLALVPIF